MKKEEIIFLIAAGIGAVIMWRWEDFKKIIEAARAKMEAQARHKATIPNKPEATNCIMLNVENKYGFFVGISIDDGIKREVISPHKKKSVCVAKKGTGSHLIRVYVLKHQNEPFGLRTKAALIDQFFIEDNKTYITPIKEYKLYLEPCFLVNFLKPKLQLYNITQIANCNNSYKIPFGIYTLTLTPTPQKFYKFIDYHGNSLQIKTSISFTPKHEGDTINILNQNGALGLNVYEKGHIEVYLGNKKFDIDNTQFIPETAYLFILNIPPDIYPLTILKDNEVIFHNQIKIKVGKFTDMITRR